MDKKEFLKKTKRIRKYFSVSLVAAELSISDETVRRYLRGVGGENTDLMAQIYAAAKGQFLKEKKEISLLRV